MKLPTMKHIYLKISLLLLLMSAPLNLAAQEKLKGNKIVTTQNRDIDGFNKIEISDNIDVIISQGSYTAVSVEADENLQDAILTDVRDSILTVRLSKKITRKKALNIYITVDSYLREITTGDRSKTSGTSTINTDELTINAGGDSKLTLDIKTTKFTLNNNESANLGLTVITEDSYLNASKTGKAKINLTADNLEMLTQGSSTTELSGACSELILNAENRSNVKAGNLECDDILIYASDGSDTHVNAKKTISITAINTSEIYIYNNPKITIEKFSDKAVLRKK